MGNNNPQLKEIWRQKEIPVIGRKGKSEPLLVKLPYAEDNQQWLRNERRNIPEWLCKFKCWKVPKNWFEDTVRRCLVKYGRIYVIQPYRKQQKCAPSCWNTVGVECECSCMGANHGSGKPAGKWHIVSDTFAVQWGTTKYACRLIEPHSHSP